MSRSRHLRPGLLAAAAVLLLDQASKTAVLYLLGLPALGSVPVLPFMAFTMVWNSGISLGIQLGEVFGGADIGRYALIGLTVGILFYLTGWLRRSAGRAEALAIGLIIGGAAGNLVDRVIYGAVADFIHVFGFGYHFYVFNLADAAITIGVGLLIADSLLFRRHKAGTADDLSPPPETPKTDHNHPV